MHIDFEVPNIEHAFYDDLYSSVKKSEVIKKIEEYLKRAEEVKEIVSKNSKINNEDLVSLLSNSLSEITLDYEDYLKILTNANGKEYIGFATIKTTMVRKVVLTEGYGDSFDFWEDLVYTKYKIIYSSDICIKNEHYYSIKELKKMIKNKNIIIIEEQEKELDTRMKKTEDYRSFDILNFKDFLDPENSLYSYTIDYIKIKISLLRKKLRKYLKKLNSEINDIIKNKTNFPLEQEVIEYYKKSLEEQGTIRKLKSLKKSLKPKKQ